ncbi:lipid A biosynthesis acyltransferase [Nannocystis pusilla]|uniref:LpxL/LpxP family acyltransferase n=1 Tax=Nannocystis pusilla TaxID=889268 RepID=UPI003BEFC06A
MAHQAGAGGHVPEDNRAGAAAGERGAGVPATAAGQGSEREAGGAAAGERGAGVPATTAGQGSEREAGGAAAVEGDRAWMTRPERGTVLGIKATLLFCRVFGRRGAGVLLAVITFYYALFAGAARRASQDYLRRIGQPHGFWASWRHIYTFARCALDRVFLVRGETSRFRITHTGIEHLRALQQQGKGALLLGAHLGSFEAMRASSADKRLPIHILAYWQNAKMISDFLRTVQADFDVRVIPIDPRDTSYILAAKEAIERGELVAVLGDRVGVNEKTCTAEFLGAPARFPTGPYTLAALLKCPIYLTFGLYHGPDRYDLYCEPFAEQLELPRGRREAATAAHVQRYAERLEHYCRLAPLNWFNFYEFWRAE